MIKEDVIICRCEDITLKDITDLLDEGYQTFEEIKRILRIGMGACQGSTCISLLQREISNYHNIPIEKVETPKVRPLMTGVKLKSIREAYKNES